MNAKPYVSAYVSAQDAGDVPTSSFVSTVAETPWGFVVRNRNLSQISRRPVQTLAFVASVAFATVALGMWVIPTASLASDAFVLKLVSSVLLGLFSFLFLRFGATNRANEVHFYNMRGECREVYARPNGRQTLISRHKFKDIVETHVVRDGLDDAVLVLRMRGNAKFVEICEGDEYELSVLGNRIKRLKNVRVDMGPITKATRTSREKTRSFSPFAQIDA